jgi:hypothetical protein
MEQKTLMIGYIDLSGKTVVSDPCYGRDVWCMAKDITVKFGKYAAYITRKNEKGWGIRTSSIMIVHVGCITSLKEDWEPYDCVIGVDSGQCGIFDDTVFPPDEEHGGEYNDENSFYGECCRLTCDGSEGGILKTHDGVVSSSGYGDGSYKLSWQYHEGERVALMVDFALKQNNTALVEAIRKGLQD